MKKLILTAFLLAIMLPIAFGWPYGNIGLGIPDSPHEQLDVGGAMMLRGPLFIVSKDQYDFEHDHTIEWDRTINAFAFLTNDVPAIVFPVSTRDDAAYIYMDDTAESVLNVHRAIRFVNYSWGSQSSVLVGVLDLDGEPLGLQWSNPDAYIYPTTNGFVFHIDGLGTWTNRPSD